MARNFTNSSRLALYALLLLAVSTPGHGGTPKWLKPFLPVRGSTIADEIKCYSLPYGGIGFASHVLTFYTLAMLRASRSPWRFTRLKASGWDMILAILQTTATIAIASFTIVRCRNRWQFILIAVWKLLLSLEVGVWGFLAALDNWAMEERDFGRYKPLAAYLIMMLLYIVPVIIGGTGVIAIFVQTIDTANTLVLTIAFGVPMWLSLKLFLVGVYVGIFKKVELLNPLVLWGCFCFVTLFAFYSDWVLGIIAGTLAGEPSSDNAVLYWVSLRSRRYINILTCLIGLLCRKAFANADVLTTD